MWEKEADLLKIEVLDIMQSYDLKEVTIKDMGKMHLKSRRAWKYTTMVTELEKKVEDQKQLEERLGAATYVENVYPEFREQKND